MTLATQAAQEFPAVHDGHHEIQQDQAGWLDRLEQGERILPVLRLEDREPFAFQELAEKLAQRFVVVHQ